MKTYRFKNSSTAILTLVFLITAFVSCSDDIRNNSENLDDLNKSLGLNYFSLITSNQNGNSVVVQDHSTFYTQQDSNNLSYFRMTPRPGYEYNIILSSHNNSLLDNTNHLVLNSDLNDFYGKTVEYDIVNESDQSIVNSEVLYVPHRILLDYTLNEITPSSSISWNPDNLNENGVIVRVMYDPIEQTDMNILYRNQSTIADAFIVDDLGEFDFDSSMLGVFPDNAIINVTIYRGTINLDNNLPVFNCFTSVRFSAKLIK